MKLNIGNLFHIKTTKHQVYFILVLLLLNLVIVNTLSYLLLSPYTFIENRLLANVEIVLLTVLATWLITHHLRKIVILKTQLEYTTNHDPLTGAGTRGKMNDFLNAQKNLSCPLILLDIDYFKQINDQHGHLVGDRILTQFVELLTKHVAPTDLVVRLGGDEFLILLTDANLLQAKSLAQEICEAVHEHRFEVGHKSIKITTSIGVSIITSVEHIDDAIQTADDAMYNAKDAGRNQVRFSAEA